MTARSSALPQTILGVTAFYHDSSAALICDGQLVGFAEEERFNRQKHTSVFPMSAIRWLLTQANCDWDQIDTVAFFLDPAKVRERFWKELLQTTLQGGADALWRRFSWTVAFHRGIATLQSYFPKAKISFVPHHLCHAAYAYGLSAFEAATVFTFDSIGEYTTSGLFEASPERLILLDEVAGLDSLGYVYGAITEFLGYKRGEGEGTVMALAAMARPDPALGRSLIQVEDSGRFRINRDWFAARFQYPNGRRLTPEFEARFGPPRRADQPLLDHHKEMAASLQWATEEAIKAFVRRGIERTLTPNVAMGGGVTLNSVINHHVRNLPEVKDLFVAPAANDGGTSLGAALYTYQHAYGRRPTIASPAYLGPSFSDEQIQRALDIAGLRYTRLEHPASKAAELIANGHIVGWFQGAMECGPRALGNRSLLADPRSETIKDKINYSVKFREWFRPFAPSVMEEHVQDWFETPQPVLPFMLEVVPIRPDKAAQIPAVLHVDQTARVQSVTAEQNPRYHELISQFYHRTQVPMVLNTSFNIKDEPIVATPMDALRCFFSTGIEFLIMGSYLVCK